MKKLLIALLIGFGIYGFIENNPNLIPSFAEKPGTSDHTITAAYRERQSDIQVRGPGKVARLLPDDNEGSRHQRFVIRLASGQTLLIAHNIDLASRINSLREGDTVDFFGEYEWPSKGSVVHWTHNDPNGLHEDGWLKHKGRVYKQPYHKLKRG